MILASNNYEHRHKYPLVKPDPFFRLTLFFAFAAGTQDINIPAVGQDDPTFWYAKLGYIADFFSCGTTAFAIDYGQHNEVSQANDDADTFGIMAVQKLNSLGTELYTSYRVFSLDRTATDIEDINVFMTGARIKF